MEFNPSDAGSGDFEPQLLEPGLYTLVVKEAEERTSRKGNPMIALVLEAEEQPGVQVRSWLVATPNALFKVKEFCEAAGLAETFKAGRLMDSDCVGKRVRAEISIEEGTDGFADQNRIERFMAPKKGISTRVDDDPSAAAPVDPPQHQAIQDKDIPF